MLRNASRDSSLNLLRPLFPTTIRNSSNHATRLPPTPTPNVQASQNHSRIRDQILNRGPSVHGIPHKTREQINKGVTAVRQSIRNGSIPRALAAWAQLAPVLDRHEPTPRNVHPIERDLAQYIEKTGRLESPQFGKGPGWTTDTHQQLQDFALTTAKGGKPEILYSYMLGGIQSKQPDLVISLYERFFSAIGGTLRHASLDSPAHELLDEGEHDTVLPIRISILLAAIAAHGIKDSFDLAFKTYLDSGIRIRAYRKTHLMEKICKDEELYNRMLKFLPRLDICHLLTHPSSFVRHIGNLARPTTLANLNKFYNLVLEGIRSDDAYISPSSSPSSLSPPRLVTMTESGWSAFQTGFMKCHRPDLAAKVWQDLTDLDVVPGQTMWTGLLDYWADLRNSREAERTWDAMLDNGVQPDVLAYRAIIAALFDDGQPEEGMKRFEEYQSRFGPKAELGIVVYNSILQGLLRRKQPWTALELFETMKTKGPAPDVVSFNTLLGYYAKLNDFKGLSKILADMKEYEISGDVVTFSTILSALLHVGRTDAVPTMLEVMKEQGIEPNVATYTAIISSLTREETPASLKAALDILVKMEQDPTIKPNEVTYTAILAGLYRGSWLSPEESAPIKKELLQRMRQRGIPMSIRTYHILIRAAMDSSEPDSYKDALALLAQMEDEGIPIPQTTWHLLFGGLISKRKWDVGSELARRLHLQGHMPSPSVLKLINDIRDRRG